MAQRLAIDGGTPILTRADYQNWPVITDDERRFIKSVLDSGIVAGGSAPQVTALEKEWREFVGAKYCLTTGSGTAALHMALAAVDVGPGDEVLVPSYTFLATASCVLHQMAIPMFVDIDPVTYTMDPARIEAAITERTKAIIPVHIQGCPADMDPILEIARKHRPARHRRRLPGARSDLQGPDVRHAGRGGSLQPQQPEEPLRRRRGACSSPTTKTCSRKGTWCAYFGDECDEATSRQKYNASILGYMYRNQELPAALARGQLMHLNEFNRHADPQRRVLEPRIGADSRRHTAGVPSRLQARLLVLRRAIRSARGRDRCHAAAVPGGGRKGAVPGRNPGRPVADDAGAGPGRVPKHDRHRQTISVGHQ